MMVGRKRKDPYMLCRHCGKQIVWDEQSGGWVHVVTANERHPADPK